MRYFYLFLFFVINDACFGQHAQVLNALQQFNADSLEAHVRKLSALESWNGTDTIKSRLSGTDGNEQAFGYIVGRLKNWNVLIDTPRFGNTGQNIIASKPGYRSDKYIMVGAHYDAVGGVQLPSHIVYPGADDNASGVAAVLETARILDKFNWPFTIRYAFWDEEEQGLFGSKAYCPPNDAENLMGYINLDMIAYDQNNDSLFEIHTSNRSHSRFLAQRAVKVLETYAIGLRHKIVDPGDQATDHASFWFTNLPAIGVNEVYSGPDFNPNWHLITDSMNKFNLSYFHRMSKLVLTLTADCAMDTVWVLAVNEKNKATGIEIYPNPATHSVQINSMNKINQISVYNKLGQLLLRQSDMFHEIDVSSLTTDTYVVKIEYHEGSPIFRKLVIE